MTQPRDRGHHRHQLSVSISPPISLYNRSFGVHRRSDSNTSVSSVAHSYVLYVTNGSCAAWARHRQDMSVDSVQSDFLVMHLGRLGIGDKMFDTAADQGMPLTLISASPLESLDLGELENSKADKTCQATNTLYYESQQFRVEDLGHMVSPPRQKVLAFREKVFGTSRQRLPAGVHGAQTSALHCQIVDADESDKMAGCDFK
jgi:hypothetical protein